MQMKLNFTKQERTKSVSITPSSRSYNKVLTLSRIRVEQPKLMIPATRSTVNLAPAEAIGAKPWSWPSFASEARSLDLLAAIS